MRTRFKIFFTCLITVFILLGFAVPANMVGNWYQQFMPNLNGRSITDVFFIDSLTGYAVTNNLSPGDTGYILKTTTSGDSWNFSFTVNRQFTAIEFVNINTGYACGGSGGGTTYLCRTTNAGLNWTLVNSPSAAKWRDMDVLSNDILWLVDSDGLTGGVYRTTDGGSSWEQKLALGNMNPEKIYMYNSDTGFVAKNIAGTPYIRRTTSSGLNWSIFVNGKGFTDMFFVNSLTGWTAFDSVRKTTNGGLNWQTQVLPYGGIISNFSTITKFSFLSKDTAWGIGGYVIYPNNQVRGIIYRTINGGANWLFQVPDTSITLAQYYFINFTDKSHGWAYSGIGRGVHTVMGGDPIWITGVRQISSNIPNDYKLYQNYPNPFNPKTIIKYQIVNSKYQKKAKVILKIFDVTGKEIITLVNEEQNAGTYEIDFSGNGYSSGVYFYSLIVNGIKIDTRKMILLK